MNIKELFYKPLDRAINGVVKADQNDNTTVYQELDEYVVTNELEKHFGVLGILPPYIAKTSEAPVCRGL